MSKYFAPAKASTSTMAMEAATSAPAVGYTVEQVRAQQSDRSFRRDVQNVHLQIIELAGEDPRSHTQAEEPTKEIDRAQLAPKKAFTRIFFSLPTKALTSASTMMSMAASALHVSLCKCYVVLVRGSAGCSAAHARRPACNGACGILAACLWYGSLGCPRMPLLLVT